MIKPFITIIMPTYNQAGFIETSLKSIFNQNIDSYEVLVYDAMSTDETPHILDKYKDRLVCYREKDSGMSEAINKGFKAGKGEVFAWLCSDDVYLPNAFSRIMEAFNKNPKIDFVYGDALEIDINGYIFTPNLFTEDYNKRRYLHSHNYLCQPTVFFRKNVFDKVGFLNEINNITMDYEWFARFHMAGLKAERLPFFLAANRDYPQTKTNASGIERYKNMLQIHAMRPGRPLMFRKSFWVYTFEAIIKSLNALSHENVMFPFLRKLSGVFGELFLRFVNPRSRDDISKRFLRDIYPYCKNIKDLWASEDKQTGV